MCGIGGFIGREGAVVDLAVLKKIGTNITCRGQNAFGFAWIMPGERFVRKFKAEGALAAHIDELDRVKGAEAVIIHTRAATHGDPAVWLNNHPHPAGFGWYVHNGVVRNYKTLLVDEKLTMKSECDSEIFGLLMDKEGGSTLEKFVKAIQKTSGSNTVAGLWARPTRLIVGRERGQDLHIRARERTVWFASSAYALPKGSTRFEDDTVLKVALMKNGTFSSCTRKIVLPAVPTWIYRRLDPAKPYGYIGMTYEDYRGLRQGTFDESGGDKDDWMKEAREEASRKARARQIAAAAMQPTEKQGGAWGIGGEEEFESCEDWKAYKRLVSDEMGRDAE